MVVSFTSFQEFPKFVLLRLTRDDLINVCKRGAREKPARIFTCKCCRRPNGPNWEEGILCSPAAGSVAISDHVCC